MSFADIHTAVCIWFHSLALLLLGIACVAVGADTVLWIIRKRKRT